MTIVFQSISFGQNFFNENSIWHQRYAGCAPNICNYENYKYVVGGDTIINNEDYLKIRKIGSGVEIVNFTGTPDTSYYDIDSYRAAIREEGKQVYLIWANSDIKRFLYDFDWEVGDTVDCPGSYCIIVDSIGTVNFGTEIRKHYFLSGTGIQSNQMIEGVGYGSGLLRIPVPTFEWGGILICYKQEENVISVSSTDSCEFEITTSVRELEQKDEIIVYPNPTQNEINIKMRNSEMISEIRLYDLSGVLINQAKEINLHRMPFKIDMSEFNKGIYFLTIQSESQIRSHKLIKIE